jgi:hypothetical protein
MPRTWFETEPRGCGGWPRLPETRAYSILCSTFLEYHLAAEWSQRCKEATLRGAYALSDLATVNPPTRSERTARLANARCPEEAWAWLENARIYRPSPLKHGGRRVLGRAAYT